MTAARFLTTQQVAEQLSVTPKTVCQWIRERKLAAYQLGSDWRVQPKDLETFIEERRREAMPLRVVRPVVVKRRLAGGRS